MRKPNRSAIAAALLLLASSSSMAEVDLSGVWNVRLHEDLPERIPGPDMAEFHGVPINDANRARGLAWDPSILTLEEYQCRPHPSDYFTRFSPERIWKEIDSETQETKGIHIRKEWQAAERTIWMDGRERPPAYAIHSWQGFSLGKWEGDVLAVETTHLKQSYVRRNGLARSDIATTREHYIRHGDYLTIVAVINDPAYLTESFIRSSDYALDNKRNIAPYPCDPVVEIVGQPKGYVPHYLPGKHPSEFEYADRFNISHEAALGGAQTAYPEFMEKGLAVGKKR
jgi:hypothetical protein